MRLWQDLCASAAQSEAFCKVEPLLLSQADGEMLLHPSVPAFTSLHIIEGGAGFTNCSLLGKALTPWGFGEKVLVMSASTWSPA